MRLRETCLPSVTFLQSTMVCPGYTFKRLLGEGAFGEVSLVERTKDGRVSCSSLANVAESLI